MIHSASDNSMSAKSDGHLARSPLGMLSSRPKYRRPRVLLSAFSCGPNMGSEPGVGWNRAVEIAKYCDTWVLTEEIDWRPRITAYLAEHGPIANLRFVYVPRRSWECAVEYTFGLNFLAYEAWQRRAYSVARCLHAELEFDLAHQLTFATYRAPGELHRLGIPFVWGPIGGTQQYPWRMMPGAGMAGIGREVTRNLANALQIRTARKSRRAARRAAAIFAANSESRDRLRRALGVECDVLCEVGASASPQPVREMPNRGPFRLLWVGGLTTNKALELLIEALALLPRGTQYVLHVVGDGPRRPQWERLAERRGVAGNICWCGPVSHQEVMAQFAWADAFVFTSLRDLTGTVVLEAMAASKAIICLGHQGAGEIVTDECGIRVPVTNRRELHRELAEAILRLERDRPRCMAMGHRAGQLAKRHSWPVQARRIAIEYNRILESVGSDARCEASDSPRRAMSHV